MKRMTCTRISDFRQRLSRFAVALVVAFLVMAQTVLADLEGLMRKAEAGDPKAQDALGCGYLVGTELKQDYVKAAYWFRKAAEAGNDSAQYYLGRLFQDGNGVEKNAVEAVKWFRKAAEQGNPDAQTMLGIAFHEGEGVEADLDEAVRWYRKAAEQGDSTAQYMLGLMHEVGEGVEEDPLMAVAWFLRAARGGDEDALVKIATLQKDPAGAEILTKAACVWRRKYLVDTYNAAAIVNAPVRAPYFTLKTPQRIDFICARHSANGAGSPPGTLALRANDGTLHGPWKAENDVGLGDSANVNWIAFPDTILPPGTYTVVDSNPATWANNKESQGLGFIRLGTFETPRPAPPVAVAEPVAPPQKVAPAPRPAPPAPEPVQADPVAEPVQAEPELPKLAEGAEQKEIPEWPKVKSAPPAKTEVISTPGLPGTLKWKVKAEKGEFRGDAGPVVAPDGTIYSFFGIYGALEAYTPEGKLKWRYREEEGERFGDNTPVLGPDGTLYVWSFNRLHAIHPDGTRKWVSQVNSNIMRVAILDGETLGVTGDWAKGVEVLRLDTGRSVRVVKGPENLELDGWMFPARDGTLYVGQGRFRQSAAFRKDGSLADPPTRYLGKSRPVQTGDGTMYFADNRVCVERPDGTSTNFCHATPDYCFIASPVIGPDGTVYATGYHSEDYSGILVALDPVDLSLKWDYRSSQCCDYKSPVIALDGSVYVGSRDGIVHAVDKNGRPLWKYQATGDVTPLALGANGVLYFGSAHEPDLYAVWTGTGAAAASRQPVPVAQPKNREAPAAPAGPRALPAMPD